MSTTKFSSGRSHTKSFQELLCSPSLMGGLQQQSSICFLAVNILLFITAFSGNSLILVALHKESSLHPPSKLLYRCLATTDLLFGLITQPPYCYKLDVLGSGTLKPLSVRTWRCLHHRLCIVFSVFDDDDGHKREQTSRLVVGAEIQIVALKRTYIIVTTFWVFTLVASLCGIFDHRIIFLYGYLVTAFCLVISLASYTKIFHSLRYHQAQVSDQQQPSQINALNMARFRKAVYSALWVQSASVVCYVPVYTVGIVITLTKNILYSWSSHGKEQLFYFRLIRR